MPVIPSLTVIAADGSKTIGGFTLEDALVVAREAEQQWEWTVTKIVQGAEISLVGAALRRALDG